MWPFFKRRLFTARYLAGLKMYGNNGVGTYKTCTRLYWMKQENVRAVINSCTKKDQLIRIFIGDDSEKKKM